MLKLADSTEIDRSKPGLWCKTDKSGKSADVWLYDVIGEDWFGGISAKAFADTIKSLGDVSSINVYVNSPGGSVFDGQAMYATLQRHPARVTMHVDGLAASIASLILMAGDEVNIAAGGQVMIHKPWTGIAGNADQLRETAEVLDKIETQAVDIYAARTRNGREQISAWMQDETWMTADEAVENGFADRKTEALKVAACAFDLKAFGYKHVPKPPSVEPAAATIEPVVPLRDRIIDSLNWLRQNPRKD